MKKKIAVITARGGSKRIPRKNIRDFFGKPIISYSIEAAIDSGLFEEVMVSTDDAEIAKVAEKIGAKIPFMRSKKNSDDYSTTAHVLLEVLEGYIKRAQSFDYLCCLYPTAPFVTAKKIKDSFNLLIENNAQSVIAVVKFSYPIQRSFRINKNGKLEYISPENINKRSQDLAPVYYDAGQFYWCEVKSFIKNESLVTTKNTIPFIVSELDAHDIDNENDWKLAEIKYKLLNRKII